VGPRGGDREGDSLLRSARRVFPRLDKTMGRGEAREPTWTSLKEQLANKTSCGISRPFSLRGWLRRFSLRESAARRPKADQAAKTVRRTRNVRPSSPVKATKRLAIRRRGAISGAHPWAILESMALANSLFVSLASVDGRRLARVLDSGDGPPAFQPFCRLSVTRKNPAHAGASRL